MLLGFAFSLNFSKLLLLLNQLEKKLYKSISIDDMTTNLRKLSMDNMSSVSNVITLWMTDMIESELIVLAVGDVDAKECDDEDES